MPGSRGPNPGSGGGPGSPGPRPGGIQRFFISSKRIRQRFSCSGFNIEATRSERASISCWMRGSTSSWIVFMVSICSRTTCSSCWDCSGLRSNSSCMSWTMRSRANPGMRRIGSKDLRHMAVDVTTPPTTAPERNTTATIKKARSHGFRGLTTDTASSGITFAPSYGMTMDAC